MAMPDFFKAMINAFCNDAVVQASIERKVIETPQGAKVHEVKMAEQFKPEDIQ